MLDQVNSMKIYIKTKKHKNIKDINQFINEAKSGTIDQFFDAINELFINTDFDDFWKTKIKLNF